MKTFVVIHIKHSGTSVAKVLNVPEEVKDDPRKIVAWYISDKTYIGYLLHVEEVENADDYLASLTDKVDVVSVTNVTEKSFRLLTKDVDDLPENYLFNLNYAPMMSAI